MSITGHLRGTVRRHPHAADVTIGLAVYVATVLTAFTGHSVPIENHSGTELSAAAVASGVLAARRRFPLFALLVSAGAAEVFLMQADGGGVLIVLAPSIALYTVAEQVERRARLILCAAAVAALALVHALLYPALLGPENLALTALGALAIAAGDSSRHRRAYLAEVEARAERAELAREQDARRRVAAERLRIARDLHDSVGHHLALISVQSDVAGRAIDADPGAAREALAHVKAASRKALGELRDTVSLLRQPGDPVAPTATPAPGLDALKDLLTSLRASGLEIDEAANGSVAPLAPAADLTAYRVIQESLTNVYKHSTTRRARLRLGYDLHEVRIEIDDLGDPASAAATRPATRKPASGRHGILGMRERVLALGGNFTAGPGPRPDVAFRVTATLPYQPLDQRLDQPLDQPLDQRIDQPFDAVPEPES